MREPRIKCGDCGNRLLVSLSDTVIYNHLAGGHTVGVYPLLEDAILSTSTRPNGGTMRGRSCFLARNWAYQQRWRFPRSGQGAHAWVFFAGCASLRRHARRLGTAIISHTCARTRQLRLTSYDRLFPNQDTMPKGGFGNLIALPLQKGPRDKGFSVFVDAELRAYPDQWAFLASIRPPWTRTTSSRPSSRATDGVHPLDVTFIDDEDLATPWTRHSTVSKKLTGSMPRSLTLTLQPHLLPQQKAAFSPWPIA